MYIRAGEFSWLINAPGWADPEFATAGGKAVSFGEFAALPGQATTSTKAESRTVTRGEALLIMWKKLDQP
jgi:hypothetical protein